MNGKRREISVSPGLINSLLSISPPTSITLWPLGVVLSGGAGSPQGPGGSRRLSRRVADAAALENSPLPPYSVHGAVAVLLLWVVLTKLCNQPTTSHSQPAASQLSAQAQRMRQTIGTAGRAHQFLSRTRSGCLLRPNEAQGVHACSTFPIRRRRSSDLY
jgi:hypothetical protein